MGNDGGTIAKRTELVRTKATQSNADVDPALRQRLRWTTCAISRAPLSKPAVSDRLGRLYNKDAVLQYLLKRADGGPLKEDAVASHLRGLKDVSTLNLTPNPAYSRPSPPSDTANGKAGSPSADASSDVSAPVPSLCPLTQRPMNGSSRFVYLRGCGCVMSEAGLRAIAGGSSNAAAEPCPVCGEPFSPSSLVKDGVTAGGDVVVLNPGEDETALMRAAMNEERAREKEAAAQRKKEKRKAAGKEDKEGQDEEDADKERKKRRKEERKEAARKLQEELGLTGDVAKPTSNPPPAPSAAAALISKNAKATSELSPALRSIYGLDKKGNNKEARDDNWMVRGTFGRYAV